MDLWSAHFYQLNHIAGWLIKTSFILSYTLIIWVKYLDRLLSSINIKFMPAE